VIAPWLGHEQITTTQIYLHADLTHKQQAIDRARPIDTKPGRYQPPTPSWPSWKRSDYADNPNTEPRPEQELLAQVGITTTSAYSCTSVRTWRFAGPVPMTICLRLSSHQPPGPCSGNLRISTR
jgi:hypothetical protein